MLIARKTLLDKLQTAIRNLKNASPIPVESVAVLRNLEDTQKLLVTAANQFNLNAFPTDKESCPILIAQKNELTHFDIEGLGYLAQSVASVLESISDILGEDT